MKYELSKERAAFVEANFKDPEAIKKSIVNFANNEDIADMPAFWAPFNRKDVEHGQEIIIYIDKDRDLVKVEPLKPGIWYPREMFDHNPDDYILAEQWHAWQIEVFTSANKSLSEKAIRFMYIERPPKQESKE